MAKKEETPETSESPGGKANADTSEDVEQGQVSAEVNKEACMWAMFCHLAGLGWLLWWIMPLIGGVIGPLVLWQIKKDKYPFVDEQGKEALNFQISMLLYCIVAGVLCFACIGFVLLVIVGVADTLFAIIASIKAGNGQHYRYPLTIRFIK
jgi:uncharacterized Tic20 family protein